MKIASKDALFSGSTVTIKRPADSEKSSASLRGHPLCRDRLQIKIHSQVPAHGHHGQMNPQTAAIDTVAEATSSWSMALAMAWYSVRKSLGIHLGDIATDIPQMCVIFRAPQFVSGNTHHIDEIPGHLAFHGHTRVLTSWTMPVAENCSVSRAETLWVSP